MKSHETERPAPRANAESRANSKIDTKRDSASASDCKGSPRSGGVGKPREGHRTSASIDFAEINRAALAAFPAVLARILPGGKRVGAEIVALNPKRADRHLGSFKINRWTGRWADFAMGDKGGDPISLVAYLANVSQVEAARMLARMLGLETGGRRGG